MSGLIAALGLGVGVLALDAGAGVHAAPPPVLPSATVTPVRGDKPVGPPSPPQLIPPIKGGTTAPPDRTYKLERARDGSGELLYRGSAFTAHVARDGSTSFDEASVSVSKKWSLFPFAPIATPTSRPSLQRVITDLLNKRKPPRNVEPQPWPNGQPPQTIMPIPGANPYVADPSEACQYPRACAFQPLLVVGPAGNADLTDELMRMNGQDPYRQEKALFLAATRELRFGMAVRAAAEDIRAARAELPARLLSIACDPSRSPHERRAIIEALRQEMDGNKPAAREAAATITRFLASFFDGDAVVGGARCPVAAGPDAGALP